MRNTPACQRQLSIPHLKMSSPIWTNFISAHILANIYINWLNFSEVLVSHSIKSNGKKKTLNRHLLDHTQQLHFQGSALFISTIITSQNTVVNQKLILCTQDLRASLQLCKTHQYNLGPVRTPVSKQNTVNCSCVLMRS